MIGAEFAGLGDVIALACAVGGVSGVVFIAGGFPACPTLMGAPDEGVALCGTGAGRGNLLPGRGCERTACGVEIVLGVPDGKGGLTGSELVCGEVEAFTRGIGRSP